MIRPRISHLQSAAALVITALASQAQATITTYAEYHLGETGSLAGAGNLPQDSSGNNRHFLSNSSGQLAAASLSPVVAPGSTRYVDSRPSGATHTGWYSTNLYSALATDNFAFGVYVSTPSSAANSDVFILGSGNGGFKLSLSGGRWAASSHNASWIGPTGGVANSWKANEWVHLAIIRKAGVSTFYINGVAQAGTYGGAPVHNSPHLNISPGGGASVDGRIDEARVLTFDASDTVPDILAALGGAPLDIRYLVRDGVNTYPKVVLGAALTSQVRPGLDTTTIADGGVFTVAAQHQLDITMIPGLAVNSPYDLFIYDAATVLDLNAFTLNLPEGVEASLSIDEVTWAPKKIRGADLHGLRADPLERHRLGRRFQLEHHRGELAGCRREPHPLCQWRSRLLR